MKEATSRQAGAVLLFLVLLVGGGNLLATYLYVHAEQSAQQRNDTARARQGALTEQKLCTTLGRLTALRPPAGNPAANPSRAFDQQLHVTLAQLGPDLGCR